MDSQFTRREFVRDTAKTKVVKAELDRAMDLPGPTCPRATSG